MVESKRWLRPLDRRSGSKGEGIAPSTQMLRYLRRVDDLTSGDLRWGILTNGARWRLYYQGARSVSEQFFEIDLAAVLDLPGHNEDLFALSESERRHGLKLFVLFFRREAFLPGTADSRTLHQRALDEGRFHQERVAANLSGLVFGRVFPELARAIAAEAPDAPLAEVRDAALVVLYRLLFILYAEDRDLLPVRDQRYDDYGLRDKVRGDVGRREDRGDTFSETAARYWSAIDDLCRAIDAGDPSIGLPPYNVGLFDRERAPLLARVRLGDRVMADVIDALSFEAGPEGRRYINYRDLSVQQLGSIYERLLEHEVVREGDEIVVRPNVFARKGSGSYYTPDELVGLILEETIGPLVRSRLDAFAAEAARLHKSRRAQRFKLDELKRLDPAKKLLDLKVCDPAMGSGHFLVGLVDYLADRVIASMAEAEAAMEGYVSPLVEDIDAVRDTVLGNAGKQGWTIHREQLDDRHVVRRMVLKRCVYGVDKNPMAVELAKVSLWLHTFTVGAPLGFLDHHLRCGDSLFGSWVRQGFDRAGKGGWLFLHQPLNWAMQAIRPMQVVEMLNDAEIDEAHHSAGVFARLRKLTEPLDTFLSLVHPLDWLNPHDEEDKAALQSFLTGTFGDPVDIAMGAAPVADRAAGSGTREASGSEANETIDVEASSTPGPGAGEASGPEAAETPRLGTKKTAGSNLPPFFPDVDSRFKFCAFVAGRSPAAEPAHCAFFLQDAEELQDPDHRFPLTAEDFAAVNPNTGTAPIFRSRRDADLTTAIYRRLPVLVGRSTGEEVKTWPVKYTTMFHMTNDSGRFRTREELEEREGAWSVGGNRFDSATGVWMPLYEGKMVQAFDHRAASIIIKPENLHCPAQPESTTSEQHCDPSWLPGPQYWVAATECGWPSESGWVLGFKEITPLCLGVGVAPFPIEQLTVQTSHEYQKCLRRPA